MVGMVDLAWFYERVTLNVGFKKDFDLKKGILTTDQPVRNFDSTCIYLCFG